MNERETAQRLAEKVDAEGGRVYYVGGCVRDRLLGRENKDIDLEVHGITPQALERVLDSLGERTSFGESFGIYALKGVSLDIAMPRRETATGRGHRDFTVDVDPFLGIENACRRRDFTVNAMMQDVLTDEIKDPFGGRRDLRDGVLRHVCDETFAEDPLRVLRGAQFAARFGFTVAPETVALCRKIDLSPLAPERVAEELKKALLQAERPSVFFSFLRETEQLDVWFPELKATIGVNQEPKYHPEGDVWNHTMLVLDEAARLRDRAKQPFAFMLAALAHDLGKPVTTAVIDGRIRAFGHEIKGIPLAETFVHRLSNEQKLVRYVADMVKLHMRPNALPEDASYKASNRLFDESTEPDDLLLLALCDARGCQRTDDRAKNRFLSARLAHYREAMTRPYVMGRDLLAAGLSPDERFSDLLAFAHRLRLSEVPKKEALKQVLARARESTSR